MNIKSTLASMVPAHLGCSSSRTNNGAMLAFNLAEHKIGRDTVYVRRNHRSFLGLWWIHASGDGWAGAGCSRRSNTIATRNEALANQWIAAVNAGKVRIEP